MFDPHIISLLANAFHKSPLFSIGAAVLFFISKNGENRVNDILSGGRPKKYFSVDNKPRTVKPQTIYLFSVFVCVVIKKN